MRPRPLGQLIDDGVEVGHRLRGGRGVLAMKVDDLLQDEFALAAAGMHDGAAGAPSVLSMDWDGWTDKDDVAVIGVGSGLTWASYVLRFGDQP